MLNSVLPECRIINVRGHYEIYDCRGNFMVSGDTEQEAIDELKEIVIKHVKEMCFATA